MISIPGKIPIVIQPLFWLVAFFVGWSWGGASFVNALLSMLVILGSVIIHELGHAITAIFFGQKARIELAVFGGFTYREGRKLKLWEEFFVVLNGPITGFLLFVLAYGIYHAVNIENPLLVYLVKFTFVANLFWTVVNLVPVLPLDGGHLMSILFEAIFGFKGVKLAIVIGITIAISVSIFFFILGQFLIGSLFLILTFESIRSLRYYKLFSEKDRDTESQQLLQSANVDFQSGRLEHALRKFKEVRSRTKEGILYAMATQEMAEIYRNQEQYQEAYTLLMPLKKSLSGDSLALFHFLAYMNADFQTVLSLSNQCYQDNPSYDTALINALACGALTMAEAAVGWLECALREGLPSIEQAIKREEFNSIRQDRRFLDFKKMHL